MWLMTDESGENSRKEIFPGHRSTENVERKFVALLAEDNEADVLIVKEAIEHYELPVEMSFPLSFMW